MLLIRSGFSIGKSYVIVSVPPIYRSGTRLKRAFSVAAPTVSMKLPVTVTSSRTVVTLRRKSNMFVGNWLSNMYFRRSHAPVLPVTVYDYAK